MKLVRPGFLDEVDNGFVEWVFGGGEDADWFVEEDDATGVCLEDFSGGDEVIEFSKLTGAVGFGVPVENDLARFQQFFSMAFPVAAAFGEELLEGHAELRIGALKILKVARYGF